MNYQISYVPYGRISPILPSLLYYLNKSEFWTHGRAVVDDILQYLYTGKMQLWAIYQAESQKIDAYIITEIKQYPQCKMFVWQYGAGEPGVTEQCDELVFDTLEHAAKDSGCAGLEVFGRPGWKPIAKKHGCTVNYVIYEKHFE